MNTPSLRLRHPLFALATSLATAVGSVVLFGFPGICGQVGGLLPSLFPSLLQSFDFLGFAGIFGLLGGMLGTVLCAIWLVATAIVRLIIPRRRSVQY